MFHNSTTLHRLNPQMQSFVKERRLTRVSMAGLKAGWAEFAWGAKKVGRGFRLASWGFGGPIWWNLAKYGWRGVKKVVGAAEYGGLTAVEAGKGVWGMTGVPAYTMGYSVYNDLKMNLSPFHKDTVPRSALRGIINLPIAIALSPFRAIGGVRDSVKNLFKHSWELTKDVVTLKPITKPIEALGAGRNVIKELINLPLEVMKRTRDAIKDVVTPPIVKPLAPVLAPPVETMSTAARSKLQYLFAIKESGRQIKEGAQRFRNAPQTARIQQQELWSNREVEQKRKLAEEAEKAKEEIKSGGSGKSENKKMAAQ